MNKWIITGVLLSLITLVTVFVIVIHSAVDQGEEVSSLYIETGLNYSPLTVVTDAKHYFGTEHYVILFGKDEHGEDLVLWMSEDLSFLRHTWLSQAYNPEQLLQQVKSVYKPITEIDLTPGIENNLFLWEAKFQNANGEFTYLYYDFFNGDLLRSITLKKR